jgi:hypothetical protein
LSTSRPRRRPPKIDTERALSTRACHRHLKDLQRAHRIPPPDVEVNERGVPKFVPPIIEQSYCTSPAAMCVELGERPHDRTLWAELEEPVDDIGLDDELEEEIR